jgi:predicted SAM-dependent methyltransferase
MMEMQSGVKMAFRKVALGLFSHRALALVRWDLYLLGVRGVNALTRQKRRIRERLAAGLRPLYLNLGSGPRGLRDDHWVNVDGVFDTNVDYRIDFNRPLPFDDESFDGVFCEHVLEHFTLADGEQLAREAHRVLRPSGCLRIVAPDAALIMRHYFDRPDELLAHRGPGAGETAMEVINAHFHQRYEHQFVYDWPTLERMLLRAGYRKVVRVGYRKGQYCPAIVLDDEKYEWESLYVEALK